MPSIIKKMSNPLSVFVWRNQVLFADSENHRVRKILRNGSTVTIAGTGVKGYNGDDQLATMAQLDPLCLFVSERGEIYIGEEGHVRKIQEWKDCHCGRNRCCRIQWRQSTGY